MDLVTLDHIANGGSGVLECQPGHVEVERYRSATKWATGAPRQYRIGATIGPHRYSDLGAWDAAAARELDAWPAIDLRAGLSARAGVRAAVSRCGYACDWGDDYGLTVRRGGVAVHLLPVALAWVNDRGQTQIIATPTPGRPVVVDDAGLWALDAFGPGIDYGARLWPDMARCVIRVNNPAALFVGLNRPTIDPTGLRLAKVLNIGYDGGKPDRDILFRQSRFRRQARAAHLTGRADETRRDPGKVPVRHTRGDALWFSEARAWDDEQGWALRQDWRRYGDDVTLSLSLAAEDVAAAVGPLCLDTTMTEEQVGASSNDGFADSLINSWNSTGIVTITGYSDTYHHYSSWMRFASVPIPASATIATSSVSLSAYADNLASTVSCRIKAENADSASTPTTYPAWTGLVWSSVYTDWSPVPSTEAGTWYQSPDISTPISVPLARAGWTQNNALGLTLFDNGSSSGAFRAWHSYDYTGNVSGAKLNATYTEAAAASALAAIMAGYRMRRA